MRTTMRKRTYLQSVSYEGYSETDGRLANKLYLKVADIAALEADYYKAIGNYEKVAKSSLNNNLMKWSVKEYYLKAGICHLATNVRYQQYFFIGIVMY